MQNCINVYEEKIEELIEQCNEIFYKPEEAHIMHYLRGLNTEEFEELLRRLNRFSLKADNIYTMQSLLDKKQQELDKIKADIKGFKEVIKGKDDFIEHFYAMNEKEIALLFAIRKNNYTSITISPDKDNNDFNYFVRHN